MVHQPKQKPHTNWKGTKSDKNQKKTFGQQTERGGLLVTNELEKALEECKARVAQIAAECRQKNRKFRDIEFDLENDRDRCLHGVSQNTTYDPSDVQRVTQIFDKPSFFIGGADSNDIVQGALGDCWFLSALSTMSTSPGLIEKFCVARDEVVGVYGFIFFRDTVWNVVIIDDLLFTSIPKYEELSPAEKHLYHFNKDLYNASARKGSQSLYFAKSGTQGETWVPLIEKAYAKLHGNYAALSGGEACEAIEDLTGGVSSFIPSKDILDIDRFWQEELLRANHDRLFGCAFDALDSTRSGNPDITVNGLYGSHAYSVLRAVEVKGKRFVVIRNPWGKNEWTGPWSDGSKEWTTEWLETLPIIGHNFGNDGQFVMEYQDFLDNWEQIDRTLLFDSSWVMSSQWLEVQARPLIRAWSYGDVSFTISIPAASPAVIVLSKLDERYFDPVSSICNWTFDFVIFKKGEKKPFASSTHARFYSRSVNLETHLEAGDYIVHVRLDRNQSRPSNYIQKLAEDWNTRKASRVVTEQSISQSIAANFNKPLNAPYLPIPLDVLAGSDIAELESKIIEIKLVEQAAAEGQNEGGEEEEEKEEEESKPLSKSQRRRRRRAKKEQEKSDGGKQTIDLDQVEDDDGDDDFEDVDDDEDGDDDEDDEDGGDGEGGAAGAAESSDPTPPPPMDDSIFLGLRVYTNKAAPASLGGQLRKAPPELFNILRDASVGA
ncbi:hypothetical protein AX16_001083 [Volvariella volvacea WC 439]|nr:hypothetical protein AX16_001083 [Volvariella volvacea WC 439]